MAAPAAAKKHAIQITTLDDVQGASCAQGSEFCSYRGALLQAVQFEDELPVQIQLLPGIHPITLGVLDEMDPGVGSKSISILGAEAGSTLDGRGKWQLVYTKARIHLNISNVTFLHGAATNRPNGGAIVNGGTMVLDNCSFVGCFARGAGGAIDNEGDLTVSSCKFVHGVAESAAGAVASFTPASTASIAHSRFFNNSAGNTGGAIQNKGKAMALSDCTFDLSFTGTTKAPGNNAGTIQNGCGNSNPCHSTLSIARCAFSNSTAKGGGFIENLEDGSIAVEASSFVAGNATGYMGGALLNSGSLACRACSFTANEAHSPNGYPQGATLALEKAGASATLQNVTIDASHMATLMGTAKYPSEIFVAEPRISLNLTFGRVTGCHANTILFNSADGGAEKWRMSGVSLCEDDGSYAEGVTINPLTQRLLHDCGATRCAPRALCTDLVRATGGGAVGTNCSCALRPDSEQPLWGFPYGADPAIPHSAGFGGCFDQTDASLQALGFGSGELGEACPLIPAFGDSATGEYACCAAQTPEWRAAGGGAHSGALNVTAAPNASDHAALASLAPGPRVVLTPATPTARVAVVTDSFGPADGSLSGPKAHASYRVNLTLLAGDELCTEVGQRGGPCRTPGGAVRLCTTTPKFPIQQLNGSMLCEAAPDGACAAHDGAALYGSYNWSLCVCPVCLARSKYACICEGPDGTATCNADGSEVSACDCATPFVISPPPPPPRGNGADAGALLLRVVLPAGVAVTLLACAALLAIRRQRRQQRLRAEYEAMLAASGPITSSLNAASAEGAPPPLKPRGAPYQPPSPAAEPPNDEEYVLD